MSSVEKYHNEQFDSVREEAHNFASQDLNLDVAPIDNIALINPAQATDLRARYGQSWSGGYDHGDNTAVVVQAETHAMPVSTSVYNRGATIHEIAHTGTANPQEHTFYSEALPGIAEYKNLQKLAELGRYRPAFSFTLERAGVELWVPSNTRYLDAREAAGTATHGATGAHSTQGLIAAVGVGLTLPKSGLTSADLLGMSSRNGEAAYYGMRHSLNSLKPGLAKEVESMPQSTNGIIQGAAIIQAEARKQGLL